VVLSLLVLAVGFQLHRSPPDPDVRLAMATTVATVPGPAPALPWPATGQAAIAVPGRGLLQQSGPETPVPIASLTKIMTAYLVLRDHPLSPTAQGPSVAMSTADQTEAEEDEEADASSIPVQSGEVLTERQLLNGLLVHSANNLADVLAVWDGGSVSAFVARMNAAAVALGMGNTHYADTNGLSQQSVSSAADQLRVAMAAMAIPTFAVVVNQTSVTLPIAGVVSNYVSSVGTDGIVGVKSGFTQAAMGCLVMAADRRVDGKTVLVMAAVTGQPGLDPLDAANTADLALVDATAGALHERSYVPNRAVAATVGMAWQSRRVTAETRGSVTLLAWPGDNVRMTFTPAPVRVGARAGTRAGTLVVRDGSEHVSVPVRTTATLPTPPLTWRLKRM
jgi:D-alanyl-D-alanine carboxypeptidase (penicillin-binding protein 5/6)